MASTLIEKIWNTKVVRRTAAAPDLLYVDMHLVHEVSSPQAFEGLRNAGRAVRRPELTLATEDHNTPTENIERPIADPVSANQVAALRDNCREFGIRQFPLGHDDQGIVHVIGPQLGLTQPGMFVVCGDSHTSTHGAFGALAFGIGTSEVEHVLATQTLPVPAFKTMAVTLEGLPPADVTAKDVVLNIIATIGTAGGQGHIIEYRGPAVDQMTMESRMTVCNMSIEAGARAGLMQPDETTFNYLRGRRFAPTGSEWDEAVESWSALRSDPGARFDKDVAIRAERMRPFVTWGTNPAQGVPIDAAVPDPSDFADPEARIAAERALRYMDLEPGTPMRDVPIDTVFVGSCTNGRLEDLRAAAAVLRGRHVAPTVRMVVVPGSAGVRLMAEQEGIADVFRAAGAEWRHAGCSMCLSMNPDRLAPGQRSASTSNRNFEGRQGAGVRTHLVSPAVAAASAVVGRITAPSDL